MYVGDGRTAQETALKAITACHKDKFIGVYTCTVSRTAINQTAAQSGLKT
jgi:hypothetical protein